VSITADEAFAVQEDRDRGKPGPKAEARDKATEWLRELLTAGPMESANVKAEAEAAGMAWRTVHRAKDDLGIKPYREQFGGTWMWKLPPDPPTCQPACQGSADPGNLASWHDSKNPCKNGDSPEAGLLPCHALELGTTGAADAAPGRERGEL
jgi:hypothetical protein